MHGKQPAADDDDAAPAAKRHTADAVEAERGAADATKTLRDVVVEQCSNPCSWLSLVPRDMMRDMLFPLIPHDQRRPKLGRAHIAPGSRYTQAGFELPTSLPAYPRGHMLFAIYDYDGTDVVAAYMPHGQGVPRDDNNTCTAVYNPRTGTIVRRLQEDWKSKCALPIVVWPPHADDSCIRGEVAPDIGNLGLSTAVINADNSATHIMFSLGVYLDDGSGTYSTQRPCRPQFGFSQQAASTTMHLLEFEQEINSLDLPPGRYTQFWSMHAAVGTDNTCYVAIDLEFYSTDDLATLWRSTRCYALRYGAEQPYRAWQLQSMAKQGQLRGMLVDRADRLLFYTGRTLYWYSADGRLLATIDNGDQPIVRVVLLHDGTLVLLHHGGWITTLQPAADATTPQKTE
jgi:hypothetical protein